jgi:CubicO group peptidase (beta-lactamase class C family)
VRAKDGATWSRGFGFADLENEVRATTLTMYRTASIAKSITAVAAMQLVENGQFDLDAPIQKYVPEFPKKRWAVTARDLVSHLGGVRHYKRGSSEILSNEPYTNVVDSLEIFAADELVHEPGTAYRYTTYGFNLLGAAVQRAAAKSFMDVLEQRIFEPIGAKSIQDDDAYRVIPHRAAGYQLQRGRIANAVPVDVSNKIPGGGLISTADDLRKFAAAMLEDRLVKRETRDLIWTARKTANGDSIGYGYGFQVAEIDGHKVVSHGGSQPGVQNLMRIWPETGVVVVLMTNLQGARLTATVGAAARILLE